MTDSLTIFGTTYTGVTGIIATDTNDTDKTYIRPQGTKSISANGTGIDVANYASVDVAVPSSTPTLEAIACAPQTGGINSIDIIPDSGRGIDGFSTVSIIGGMSYKDVTASNQDQYIYPESDDTLIANLINYTSGTSSSYSGTFSLPSSAYDEIVNFSCKIKYINGGFTESCTVCWPFVYPSDGTAENLPARFVVYDIDGGVFDINLTTTSISVSERDSMQITEVKLDVVSKSVYGFAGIHVNAAELQDKTVTENGTVTADSGYYGLGTVTVNVGGGSTPQYQSKTVTPTTSQQVVTPDSGYDALEQVTVNAMPTGTAGTPTATKGTVTNHSVTVTPSVTNTTGYITGSTKTGTAVTVSASELVSGSETKTANGTYDVTNLASLVVNIPLQTVYTGSSAPSSSTGVNGDIYIQS